MNRLALPCALAIVVTAAAVASRAAAARPDAAAILGVWRGTSTCTHRKVAPACRDEQVVYRFVPIPGKPATTVLLEADKLVGGAPERMGEMEFRLDGSTGAWTSDFANARFHGVWSFTIDGRTITGTLTDVPTKAVVRRIAVTRDYTPER